MVLNRRKLLVAGSGLGAAALLYGCSDSSNNNAPTPAASSSSSSTAPAGEVVLYDGGPIEPIDSQEINNPDGIQDRPLGGVNANVTLIEYVSPTCPHCAAFHANVLPRLKETYIDTGKIRFVARPFRRVVLDSAVFMVALNSGNAYNDVLSAYMRTQNQWATAADPSAAIFEVAQQFGFTQERFEQALTDETLFAGLESMREQALNKFGLQGTPTFYLNGQRIDAGSANFDSLSAAIEAKL